MGKQTFCALRCHACTRFSVQLQKKSNKWACPVCGTKQSALCCFAVGDTARDVRLVVQQLNAGQGAAAEAAAAQQPPDDTAAPSGPPQQQQGPRPAPARRWKEFEEEAASDGEGWDDDSGGGGGGGGGGPYVTALPGEGRSGAPGAHRGKRRGAGSDNGGALSGGGGDIGIAGKRSGGGGGGSGSGNAGGMGAWGHKRPKGLVEQQAPVVRPGAGAWQGAVRPPPQLHRPAPAGAARPWELAPRTQAGAPAPGRPPGQPWALAPRQPPAPPQQAPQHPPQQQQQQQQPGRQWQAQHSSAPPATRLQPPRPQHQQHPHVQDQQQQRGAGPGLAPKAPGAAAGGGQAKASAWDAFLDEEADPGSGSDAENSDGGSLDGGGRGGWGAPRPPARQQNLCL
jgi:hypothetical protein